MLVFICLQSSSNLATRFSKLSTRPVNAESSYSSLQLANSNVAIYNNVRIFLIVIIILID